MVFDNIVLVGSSELFKKGKAGKIQYVSTKKSFIVFLCFFMYFIEEGDQFYFCESESPPLPPPPLSTHTHTPYTGTYIGRWYKD